MFYVYDPEHHVEPALIKRAKTEQEAAIMWVQQFEMDQCQYPVASGHETRTVHVFTYEQYRRVPVELTEEAGEEVEWLVHDHFTFEVAGETVPHYYIQRGKS